MKKKAFTLIELIAVLVILAILALIVTPLVMNIIRKAKISADKRSIDAYGRSVELAIATYLLDTGTFPNDLKNLNVEYTGKVVSCNVMQMKENGGIYLSECSVGTKEVKDSSTEDGWYHYGTRDLTNEEYVDMYGLALKNASVAYYNTNGNPVEDYTTLTIDYKGKPVACDVTINYDGSIYMTKCKVNNVDVTSVTEEDGYYHYGRLFKNYDVGDSIRYNNINYYVINDNESSVTLLKAIPLTADEINQYGGVGTENNHVNMYVNPTESYYQTAGTTSKGYGGVAFYTSENCGISTVVSAGNISYNRITTDCKRDYESSEVKYIVDAWATDIANETDLIADSTGYKARLPERSDFGMIPSGTNVSYVAPSWVYDNYSYWLANIDGYSGVPASVEMFSYGGYAYFNPGNVYSLSVVRPVITIKKSVLEN